MGDLESFGKVENVQARRSSAKARGKTCNLDRNLYAAGGGQVPMQLVPQVWLAGQP
jgi:hypothetical protein